MLINKIIGEMTDEELSKAFLEIEDWMNTGILNQEGVLKQFHAKYEEQMRGEQPLQVTEKAILFEMGKRFINKILKKQ